MSRILHVHVPKAEATVEIDIEAIGEENWDKIIMAGLSHFINLRMSKITGLKDLEGEKLAAAHADALAIAKENVSKILSGSIGTKAKAGASKPSGREVTIAVQLARQFLKDQMRIANIRLNTVPAKDLTAAAKRLVETDQSYLDAARKQLAEAEAKSTEASAFNINDFVKASPILVAKLEAEKKAKAKDKPLSAKQAGKAKATAKAKPKAPGAIPATTPAHEHHPVH
jgi:hypothetical protein